MKPKKRVFLGGCTEVLIENKKKKKQSSKGQDKLSR